MDLYDEFANLIDALEAATADYAVCGGLAMAIHGFPRATNLKRLRGSGQDQDDIKRLEVDDS